MILRTAGGKAKNGMTSCQARRQEGRLRGISGPIRLRNLRALSRPRDHPWPDKSASGLGDGLAILPAAEVQGMAHQMHDAGLDGGVGKEPR